MNRIKLIALLERLRHAGSESEKKNIISIAVKELKALGLGNNEILAFFRGSSFPNRGFGDVIIKSETIDSWKSNEDDYLALLKEVLKDSE